MNDLTHCPDLTTLANEINEEHQQFEQLLRQSLDRARRAGELLLKAKAALPDGQWLPWLKANIQATPRTAQRYMRIANAWGILESRCDTVSQLSMRDAITLLTESRNTIAPTVAVQDSDKDGEDLDVEPQEDWDEPVAVAHYYEAGLLDDASLIALLKVRDDYGPQVLHRFGDLDALVHPAVTAEDAWQLCNAMRPLDHPTLWPRCGDKLYMTPHGEIVLEGLSPRGCSRPAPQ
jgi:hypothetical protein